MIRTASSTSPSSSESLGRVQAGAEGPDALLFELEERYSALCVEMASVELRLRELRTAAEVCPLCGGGGQRWVRGGLYGEMQQRPCPCQAR